MIALATPVSAELQIYINIGGSVLTCAASAACNTSGLPDEITLASFTLNGVTVTGEEALSVSGPSGDALSNSVLTVTNTTGTLKAATVVVSQTDYAGSIKSFSAAGGATFNFSAGSTLGLSFYADVANGQGAGLTGATPGTLLSSTLLGPVGGGSQGVKPGERVRIVHWGWPGLNDRKGDLYHCGGRVCDQSRHVGRPVRGSGALDLGDDDHWLRRARLRGFPPRLQGSGGRDLTVAETSKLKGRRRAALCFLDYRSGKVKSYPK